MSSIGVTDLKTLIYPSSEGYPLWKGLMCSNMFSLQNYVRHLLLCCPNAFLSMNKTLTQFLADMA